MKKLVLQAVLLSTATLQQPYCIAQNLAGTSRKVGIDPIYGKENLVWAPRRVIGQHDKITLENVVKQLWDLDALDGNYDDFVDLLRRLGQLAAERQ